MEEGYNVPCKEEGEGEEQEEANNNMEMRRRD
jgi:hypothetical protein